ncbi:MAG TPA: flavodoxin domain-containing protein [Candidatus Limnocylindrales bacterium]|nr:flavodoxin domain-containing protein [Candidatus Limnocylindrales bacterium]
MNVLITAASKHGSTAAIADAIALELRAAGIETDVIAPDRVRSVAGYDAVVIGSGVYIGKWLDSARKLIEREAASLATRPVWLFSSGPLGDPPLPAVDPDVSAFIEATRARSHRVIPGKFDRSQLSFGERALTRHAAAGDFRPWPEIEAWAREIVTALTAEAAAPGS